MKKFVVAPILLLIFATSIFADVPKTINYQGRLRTTANQPVADGQYMITFRLYDADTAGTKVWEESQLVNTKQGYFNTTLGNINAMSTSMFDKPLWLALKVGNEAEMTPRMVLGSSAQALNVADGTITNSKLASNSVTTDKVIDNAINTNKIADASITTSKISDHAVTSAKIADGAINNQLKAPWAPFMTNNTKIIVGTGQTNSNGDYHINFPSGTFTSGPLTFVSPLWISYDNAFIVIVKNNATKDGVDVISFMQSGTDHVKSGSVWFYWLALGQ